MNDLDRGEDRRMLLAAEEDGVRGSGHGRLPVRRGGRWVQGSGWGARAPSLTNEIAWRLTSGDSGDVCQLWVAEEASDDLR